MRRAVVLVIAAAVFSASVTAAVVPAEQNLAVEQTVSDVDGLQDVAIDGYALAYDGAQISALTVYVNNTVGELTADVRAALKHKNGSVLVTKQKSVVLTTGVNEVTISYSQSYSVRNVTRIRVGAGKSL